MNCLVVLAHPLENSLCHYLAAETINHLKEKGYKVTIKDLYKEQFDPVLTPAERSSYYEPTFDTVHVANDIAQLLEADALILIFPTWWFGFPAILKGWFDRVWAPGYAYDHASDFGPIQPRLSNLKEMKVVTTLGSAWWVDVLVLWQPVKRILKRALLGACAPNCKFKMLSLYKCEGISKEKVDKFVHRIKNNF